MPRTSLPTLLSPVALAAALYCWCTPSIASPIAFSQAPPGNGGREPAPNVIVTVDDSGSMDEADVSGIRRIDHLKNALFNTFGNYKAHNPKDREGHIPDGRIRLAWQAMHDNGRSQPRHSATQLIPGAVNAIRPYQGNHRKNFSEFVTSLKPKQNTPSHRMLANVLTYMQTPAGRHSPWADQPGILQASPYLPCRRTYHVFMTDGIWSMPLDGDYRLGGENPGGIDATPQLLGDGKTYYDPHSNQTAAYRDDYGGEDTLDPSTLADYAFAAWAKDLQDGTNQTQNMAQAVRPVVRHKGPETFVTPACSSQPQTCVTLEEFWNPRNDPATWQHVTTYTIGFGSDTENLNPTQEKVYKFNHWLNTWFWTGAFMDVINPKPAEYGFWPSRDTGVPAWDKTGADDTFGGDFAALVNDEKHWGDVYSDHKLRTSELWHMAVNGRGRFYPARTGGALRTAFEDILGHIIQDTSGAQTGATTSTGFLRTAQSLFVAGYDSETGTGHLHARTVAAKTGQLNAKLLWKARIAPVNGASSRVVLSAHQNRGYSWALYDALPAAHKAALGSDRGRQVDALGQARWRYLRGERYQEQSQKGPFRNRAALLGDIVNSNIWYTGKPSSGYQSQDYTKFRAPHHTTDNPGGQGDRPAMVYVGANDGMLHGFAAADWSNPQRKIAGGDELLAYIPAGIAAGALRELTEPSYRHRYFVDGSPFTGDAYLRQSAGAEPAWATVLIGTLGAGGKGYFALDVTDPRRFSDAQAQDLVLFDTTDQTDDPDLGYLFSPPVVDDTVASKSRQIVRLNNGRWAVLLGNGYNSTNEAPVLYIHYLDGALERAKLSPCTQPIASHVCGFKSSNGLSAPQAVDLNGDGNIDVVYAGDLQGHLWKFDLGSNDDKQWTVAFNNAPFFVARGDKQQVQAITAAPYWRPHPGGGGMVTVGTGRNLTVEDTSSVTTETLYALHDDSQFTVSTQGVTLKNTKVINTTLAPAFTNTLVEQKTAPTALAVGNVNIYQSSSLAITQATQTRGWYMHFPLPGQRMLHNIRAFSGEKILVQSTIPRSSNATQASTRETCAPQVRPARTFLSVLNQFTGHPPKEAVFTVPTVALPTNGASNVYSMVERPSGPVSIVRTDSDIRLLDTACPAGQSCAATSLNSGHFDGTRAGWRHLQ